MGENPLGATAGVSSHLALPQGRVEIKRILGAAPTLVLLHEGLGSIAMWRDFPEKLAAATGRAVLVYSRFGYGQSDPCQLPRPMDYLDPESLEVLPAIVEAEAIGPHVLVGHSDGASIALIHAGRGPHRNLLGAVCIAPHVFVEDVSVASIAVAKTAYEQGDFRARLARYHGNVDVAFRGWNDAWLDLRFRAWNIEAVLPGIRVPLLLIQGEGDEYGTRLQVDTIARQTGGPAEVLMLPDCGHSPHRDQPAALLAGINRFVTSLL